MSKGYTRYYVDLGAPELTQVTEDQFDRYLDELGPWNFDQECTETEDRFYYYHNPDHIRALIYTNWEEFA